MEIEKTVREQNSTSFPKRSVTLSSEFQSKVHEMAILEHKNEDDADEDDAAMIDELKQDILCLLVNDILEVPGFVDCVVTQCREIAQKVCHKCFQPFCESCDEDDHMCFDQKRKKRKNNDIDDHISKDLAKINKARKTKEDTRHPIDLDEIPNDKDDECNEGDE